MKEILASGQVGNIELNHQQKVRAQIAERWDKIGFTNGLEGHIKENIATLFENQAKSMLNESTTADNSGSFETVVFPIVRRVFSKLLANDIVSVQAMNLPIGKLFYLLPVTSERIWTPGPGGGLDGTEGKHAGIIGFKHQNKNTGLEEKGFYLPLDVVNDPATASVTEYMQKSLYDLFYNDGLYDNSKGKITIKVGTASPVVLGDDGFTPFAGPLSGYPVSAYDKSIRNVIVEVAGFSSVKPGKLIGPDGNEMDTEEFLASLKVITNGVIADTSGEDKYSTFVEGESVSFRLPAQKYGTGIVGYSSVGTDGKLYLELNLAKPVKTVQATIDGYVGVNPGDMTDMSMFTVAWSQYDSLELETEIADVSFKIESVVVSVQERKLRASWSPELSQDVSAFHNIDAEAELTGLLSEQIGAEIDREILRDLRAGAPWTANWDVNGWRRQAGFSTSYTQKDWNQELMTKINQISAQIHKATLKGGANFIVVSSEISALFDNLEYFHVSDASAESDQYNMGIERIGALSGRYQVYRDPYSPAHSIIIGHKGKSMLDTGYVYAPYVPMQLTPVMYNPENFAPVKGIMTRYAKKMVNNRYYGHIRVDGLVTWSTNELR